MNKGRPKNQPIEQTAEKYGMTVEQWRAVPANRKIAMAKSYRRATSLGFTYTQWASMTLSQKKRAGMK